MGNRARPHPKPQPIKLFLREWRQYRDGMTQERLAEAIGTTKATISRIESGKQNWDQEFLQLAAKVLSCDPQDLIVRDPTKPDALWSVVDGLKSLPKREQAARLIKALDQTGT